MKRRTIFTVKECMNMQKPTCCLMAGLFFFASTPVFAQGEGARQEPGATRLSPSAASLTQHLQMGSNQIERLDRLYQRYAPARAKQEAALAQQRSELQSAQAPTTFDERKSARLLRDIEQTKQEMAADALAARADALKILTPVQRSQLEAYSRDSRIIMREDNAYLLLASPVYESWGQNNTVRSATSGRPYERRRDKDPITGRYGVYGGYGYGGPQYGVYGSAGKGAIGVYGGLGRGGPSIGIGIGRVFGLGRFGR